jgi:hypothetical protein
VKISSENGPTTVTVHGTKKIIDLMNDMNGNMFKNKKAILIFTSLGVHFEKLNIVLEFAESK